MLVIITSLIIGLLSIGVISVTFNSQISARIAPNLNDLIVALAAGAAAAFAYSRFDVADSLPGVAIAIALVPPLSVVGLCLSAGKWVAALGAMLLFTTNLLSILLAGGAVFALLGLGKASAKYRDLSPQAERRVYRIIALGVLLIAIPLVLTTVRIARDNYSHIRAKQLTLEWLNDNKVEHELNRISANSGDVLIELNGPQDLNTLSDLVQRLADSLPPYKTAILRINFVQDLPIEQATEPDS